MYVTKALEGDNIRKNTGIIKSETERDKTNDTFECKRKNDISSSKETTNRRYDEYVMCMHPDM